MPPRLALPPRPTPPSHRIRPSCCARLLHGSRVLCAAAHDTTGKNHYDMLRVRHDASPGEIKKSFYSLSKTHHPDVNPDPLAAHTFAMLAESYTVLSDPARRARYDRDVLRLHQLHQAHHRRGASYHSSHPAGGRPASGLSRRRGTFRGPPPSFFRNGGWGTGAQADARRRASDEEAARSATQPPPDPRPGPGPGPGAFPFAGSTASPVPPHFDRDAHARTHRREDARREHRRRALDDDDIEFEPQTSLAGHFLIVAGILGATFLAPLVYLRVRSFGRLEKEKG